MDQKVTVDIAIIGGGAGGLSIAAAASQLGVKVALIESGKMGGDCLNYGCIPSKSLLAAAKSAKECRNALSFGIHAEISIDFSKAMAHVRNVIDTLAEHDSIERFTKLGVLVLQERGAFLDTNTLIAGDTVVSARRFIVATGSNPAIPPIKGLETTNYFTNETIFSLTQKPEHLIVIGGGPIGCELSQAFALLGCKTTLIESGYILSKDDKELVNILREELINDGVTIYESTTVLEVQSNSKLIQVSVNRSGELATITGTHLLIATGRRASVAGLNLEAAHVAYNEHGIQVDHRLRTTNKRVFAMGDVVGKYQFTHMASYHAGIITRNILFRIPAKVQERVIPWVTYTLPELAHVGLSEQDVVQRNLSVKINTFPFRNIDRAQTESKILGSIKLITTQKGKVLGVTILGEQAGELILPWIIAIQKNRTVRDFADAIVPYPTLSEIHKRVTGEFYKPLLFSKRVKQIVRLLAWLG